MSDGYGCQHDENMSVDPTTASKDDSAAKGSDVPHKAINSSRNGSTGPRTPIGQRIASRNSLKFGFFAREFKEFHLIDAEDTKDYERLLKALIKYWQPVGQMELIQVEFMSIHLHHQKHLLRRARPRRENRTEDSSYALPPLDFIEAYQRCESHNLRNFYRAKAELERLQAIRMGNKVAPRLTMDVNTQ